MRVDSDYRARAWERFTINGERALSDQKYDIAGVAFESAIDQARQGGLDDMHLAQSLSNLGWTRMKGGQLQKAVQIFAECSKVCDRLDANHTVNGPALDLVRARMETGLGECARGSMKQDEAIAHYRKALGIFKNGSFPADCGYGAIGEIATIAYSGLGDSLIACNKPSDALDAFRSAAEVSDITPGRLVLKDAARDKYVRMLKTFQSAPHR